MKVNKSKHCAVVIKGGCVIFWYRDIFAKMNGHLVGIFRYCDIFAEMNGHLVGI